MRKSTRVLVLLGSLALLLVYVLPLWRIDLHAPQYPEGLGLRIRISSVEGTRPNDLQNINGLNHYIGMKPIDPGSIPELRLMPFVIAALVGVGLVAAASGRRWLLALWAGTLAVAAVAGLIDFYMWGYDYGHNLDPRAAIQVPGMSYQPPLIGSKQLLNIRAVSMPAAGGWIGIAVGAAAFLLLGRELRRPARRLGSVPSVAVLPLLLVGAFAVAACTPRPRPIAYGEDACTLCRMVVADERYGAEMVLQTGRVHTFDSIECMASFYNDSSAHDAIASLWVTDFEQPRTLVDAAGAVFLHSPALSSPMGAGLTAFADSAAAAAALTAHGGTLLSWPELLRHVERQWQPGGGHGQGGQPHGTS